MSESFYDSMTEQDKADIMTNRSTMKIAIFYGSLKRSHPGQILVNQFGQPEFYIRMAVVDVPSDIASGRQIDCAEFALSQPQMDDETYLIFVEL